MKNLYLIIMILWLISCSNEKNKKLMIEIKTELGSIIAEVYPDKAPITSANFLKYIKNHKFDGASFYRVVRMNNQPDNDIKIEVIQGGLGVNDADDSPYQPISHETTNDTGILHNDGVLSMARDGPGTASSEFFITIGNQPSLDFGGQRNKDGQGFATFGQVVGGMDIVKKIQQSKDKGQMLIDKVKIYSITIL